MIKLEKISRTPSSPFPEDLLDVTSNMENSTLTPGGTVKLTGKDMKINSFKTWQNIIYVPYGLIFNNFLWQISPGEELSSG
jgi:hypothetical protein